MVLKTETPTYYSYVGTDKDELLVEEATGYLKSDIAEQIKDMEITLQHKKKEQLNRSVTFYQLGIFALILVLVLYACVVHMFSVPMFFS